MILLISTCHDKLHEDEFVKPIAKIVGKCHIKHYTNISLNYDKIIICGTALKDNKYIDNLKYFNWIKTFKRPVLGICSGMQILGLQFGAKLVKQKEIGMIKVKANKLFSGEFDAYALHQNGLKDLGEFEVIAENKYVQGIKRNNMYGIMFHPEVRNGWVIGRFLSI